MNLGLETLVILMTASSKGLGRATGVSLLVDGGICRGTM